MFVQISNGFWTKWRPFVWISNGWASGFQIPFEIQTICNPTCFGPFEIQTRSDFRSPLYLTIWISDYIVFQIPVVFQSRMWSEFVISIFRRRTRTEHQKKLCCQSPGSRGWSHSIRRRKGKIMSIYPFHRNDKLKVLRYFTLGSIQ